jgi:hypothetical protein
MSDDPRGGDDPRDRDDHSRDLGRVSLSSRDPRARERVDPQRTRPVDRRSTTVCRSPGS